jgi:hypothetical protein
MITCKKSTEWIIKKEHGNLSVKQNLQLLSHLTICSFCRLFGEQSLLLNKVLNNNTFSNMPALTELDKKNMFRYIRNKISE